METKISNHEVLKKVGKYDWQHHTMFRHIHLTQNGNIITIEHKDWQGNPFEYLPTQIRITGYDNINRQELEPYEYLEEDGTIDLSEYAGCTVTVETLNTNVENAKLEGIEL